MRFDVASTAGPDDAVPAGRSEPDSAAGEHLGGPDALGEIAQLRHEVSQLIGTDGSTARRRAVSGLLGELERDVRQEGRFVSDVSHELRSPIAGLRAQLEEAQLYPGETPLRDVVDRALGDVDRLEAIVSDLLQLARLDGHAPRDRAKTDLAELALAEISRRTDRPAPRVRAEPGVTVDIVRTQISRVITNLLDNAHRHAERTVEVDVGRDGDSAELAVADDGAGIAGEDREKIFERFARLAAGRRRDCGGTGLGLAISREIARAHSGSLRVEDSTSGGARFVLRLPLA